MLTAASEDYLKAIYEVGRTRDTVTTSALAEELAVSPAAVTGMVKKLAALDLVRHEPYQGVALTDTGRRSALGIIRQHRLIETYLHAKLDVPWDQVHDEAEKMEHAISNDLEARIDKALGHPTVDPHGAPIPSADLTLLEPERTSLAELEPKQKGKVVEVSDHDSDLLRYVGSMGLYPGASFQVVEAAPFDGPLTLRVKGREQVVGREAARFIYVETSA